MSSFIRNVAHKSTPSARCPVGFYPSRYNALPTTATGIASLDDVIGGGLPISCGLMVDEDLDSSHARLMLRYWVAQGLASGQHVVVVGSSLLEGGDPNHLVQNLMSLAEGDQDTPTAGLGRTLASDDHLHGPADSEDEEDSVTKDNRQMKIAWRYEGMAKHHAVAEASHRQARCFQFDLSRKLQLSDDQKARIHCIDSANCGSYSEVLSAIRSAVSTHAAASVEDSSGPSIRIAVQSLGSAGWPPDANTALYRFVLGVKYLLRHAPAVAMLSFNSAHNSPHLQQILPWAVDGYLSIDSFGTNEASQDAFPNHLGTVQLIRLPCSSSLSPAATKLSVLRGLGGSTSGARIDSNLGFKLGRRKGFRIEMMGLGAALDNDPVPDAPARPSVQARVITEVTLQQNPKAVAPTAKSRARVRFQSSQASQSEIHPVQDLANTDW